MRLGFVCSENFKYSETETMTISGIHIQLCHRTAVAHLSQCKLNDDVFTHLS